MRDFWAEVKSFFRKGDMVLLVLCLAASAFSCLMVASATNGRSSGSARYLIIQAAAALLGVLMYIFMSSIDVDFFSEHRTILAAFNIGLILLLIPFGVDYGSGNKSWLDIGLPIALQPAEICKIFFILIMASVMASHQNQLSKPLSVFHLCFHLAILAGANLVISGDLGVTLIFVFVFAAMAFTGGIGMLWFGVAGIGLATVGPVFWNKFMSDNQKNRILVLIWPDKIDPTGLKERWHLTESLKSLTGGGMLGQGLFNGNRTQANQLQAQHTDFIFSAIGEELGFMGCFLVLLLLFAIVARCIWVGKRSKDYMRRMICFGAAAALIFQILVNVGMCIGVMPVIGLTLPLISYGGSSVVSIYAMLGLVSGVHARPSPRSHERYIHPPR